MALYKFLRGNSANLANVTVEDGAFYLTEDTNHLYIGKGEDVLAKINGNIHAVSALPTTGEAGEFYYLPGQNILAYYDTTKRPTETDPNAVIGWVQLNPDTNTDIKVASAEIKKSATQPDPTNKIVYDVVLGRTDINDNKVEDITTTFEINSADIGTIITKTEVDVNATIDTETNKATIKTNGAGAAGDGLTIVGTDGIKITGSADAIEIDGTTYELSVDGTTIKLTDSDEEAAGSATIVGDDDWTAAAANEKGEIEVSHKEKTVSTPGAVTGTVTNKKFVAVTGITTDKNHVTGIETSEFTVPDTIYSLGSVEGNLENEKYTQKIQLKDEAGQVVTNGEVEVKVAHKITIDGTERIVKNGDDLGSFYSASEIDRQHKAIDAMVYRGTVASAADLNAKEDVQIGDTYKASADFDLGSVSVAKGDLLIANGEEDTDGYLSTVTWDHIESGADADTQYELSAAADTITLANTVDDTTDIIDLEDSEKIELTTAVSTKGHAGAIVANHKGTKATQTPVAAAEKGYGETITVVTEVADDDTGHVTEVKTQTITLPKDDKVVVTADAPKFEIQTAADAKKGSIVIDEKANTPITVSGAVSGTDLTVTVEHDALTVGTGTDDAQSVALSGEGKFTVISSIENDGFGHLKTVKTKEVTIGKETTYDLTGSVENKVAKVSLTDSNNVTDVVEFSSETLTYTSTEANKIKVELEWGTF